MKLSRLFGLIVGVVLVAGLMAAATASAADPEFKTAGTFPVLIKGLSLESVLRSSTQTFTCLHDHLHGIVLGPSKVSGILLLFLGCTAKEGSGTACAAKSKGGTTGDITTRDLDGELGLSTESKTGVGVLFLPETTKEFVTLEAECTEPKVGEVEGGVVGEASPIGVLSTTGRILLGATATTQSIKKITVLGSVVEPKFKAFGLPATEVSEDSIEYGAKVEVT
jgi:hypothetical protein